MVERAVVPALTAKQLENIKRGGEIGWNTEQDVAIEAVLRVPPEKLPAVIAVANDALLDSDVRKITREMVTQLREIVQDERSGAELGERGIALSVIDQVERIADALETLLPPLPPTDG
jgi:hypothetical protein